MGLGLHVQDSKFQLQTSFSALGFGVGHFTALSQRLVVVGGYTSCMAEPDLNPTTKQLNPATDNDAFRSAAHMRLVQSAQASRSWLSFEGTGG